MACYDKIIFFREINYRSCYPISKIFLQSSYQNWQSIFFFMKKLFEGYCFLWWVKLLLSLILVPASLLCPMTHESMKCTVWKNQKFTLTWFFSWNQFISDLLVTNVDLMEFFQNFVRVKSCNFHTVKY